MPELMTRFDRWWAPWNGPITTFPHMDIGHAEYIYQVAKSAKSILVFGSRGCAIWLAQMCWHSAKITTIARDLSETQSVRQVLDALMGANVGVGHVISLTRRDAGPYVSIVEPPVLYHFDLVIVDGDWRVECLKALATADVNDVILHDSQRTEYIPGRRAFATPGWYYVGETYDKSEVKAGLWHVRKSASAEE